MSYQERRNIVSIISSILISAFYYMYVFQMYQEEGFDSTNIFSFWASVILIFVLVQIVVKIVMHIVFHIINTVVTREEEDPSFLDERDKLIELKAIKNSFIVFGTGFFLSMGSQVVDMPPFTMFNILLFSLIAADIIGEISQLYFYRRGV